MMIEDLSFKEVCRLLKQHEPKLLDTVDTVLGPVIILSGLAAAASGVPGAIAIAGGLLGPKSALSAAGGKLLKYVAGKSYGGPLDRYQRMQVAYCLLSFTAFFDAIDKTFPAIHTAFRLSPGEKLSLLKSATSNGRTVEAEAKPSTHAEPLRQALEAVGGVLDQEVPLPHPAEGTDASEARLKRLYEELTRGYQHFLQGLAAWEDANDKKRKEVAQLITNMSDVALASYRAQYVDLARQFPEFFVWATLYEHEKHRVQLVQLSDLWKRQVEFSRTASERVDLGLRELGDAIRRLPATIADHAPATAIRELMLRYAGYIEQPVIEEEFPALPGAEPLRFPKRSDAFVPQAFRVLRATGRERLEDEATWRTLEERQDLGAFLLSYFASPYSFRYPLLILGDPGSGKSLLTHVLAARLADSNFTPIRVALRALESDEISQQIEEQVSSDTNGQRVSWPSLNNQLGDAPAVVLLDGYDELLQASGRAFAGYLQSVRQFQDSELTLKRPPVRAVVTSRITLIDKTRIPSGTTVLRLEAFDKPRRDKWIEVWNRTNADYFKRSTPEVRPFELPEDDKQIVDLAQQPLLLLMLAIYDSHSNELRMQKGLDRTRLYEDLLRRFVERELSKSPEFRSLREAEQRSFVDIELDRLGVVAISMFNRRSLLIRTEELEVDLRLFGHDRQRQVTEGRSLRQADLLLGSFFFVHESRSTVKGSSSGESEVESAFQFLHNTFGEFLAARFLVERMIEQANKVFLLSQSPVLSAELDRKLSDPDGLGTGWLAGLMYAPLFSRPVVLEMIREWVPHRLRDTISIDAFRSSLDKIVDAELRRMLERGQFASLMKSPANASFQSLPLLGHLAIYTNNLVVVRATIPDGRFQFDESEHKTYEDGARPWDRLAHVWRSWFSLDSLHGLTAILITRRHEEGVHLEVRERFTTPSPRDRLESVRDVGRVLGDGVLAGLAALESWDARAEVDELEKIRDDLERERIDLRIELATRQLRSWLASSPPREELERIFKESVELVRRFGQERPVKTLEMARALLALAPSVAWHPVGGWLVRELIEWALEGPAEVAIGALELLLDAGFGEVDLSMMEEVFDRLRRRTPRMEDPRYAVSILRLAVRVGHWPMATRLAKEMLSQERHRRSTHQRRRPRQDKLPFDFGFGPEAALALLQVALAMRERHEEPWTSERLEELWRRYLDPEVVALLPPHTAAEALRLLPQVLEVEPARAWLEHFFDMSGEHRFSFGMRRWPQMGISSAIILTVADVALQLGSPIAERLADALVHRHPGHVFAPWKDPESRISKRFHSLTFSWNELLLSQTIRLVRAAPNKEQAGIWFNDFIREVLLPSVGEARNLSIGLMMELARAIEDLPVDPDRIGISSRLLRSALQEAKDLLQSATERLEGADPSPRRYRRPRGPEVR